MAIFFLVLLFCFSLIWLLVCAKTSLGNSRVGINLPCQLFHSHPSLVPTSRQKQRLTVIAARFYHYGVKASHLKTIGMALQGVIGEVLVVHTKTPWSSAESTAWNWFWEHIELSLTWTIEAYEQARTSDVTL